MTVQRGVHIIYFVHGTTTDNLRRIASGWNDVELAPLGRQQATNLRKQVREHKVDLVFCSDLRRATESSELTWGGLVDVVRDMRLRECNYGELNGAAAAQVEAQFPDRIDRAFPGGESLKDVERRIRLFLEDLMAGNDGKRIAVVSHRAP